MIKILLTAFILATISLKYAEFVKPNLPGYFDFYKLFHNFNVCFKTSNVLYIDDDDDTNFNTLQRYQMIICIMKLIKKIIKTYLSIVKGGFFLWLNVRKSKQ